MNEAVAYTGGDQIESYSDNAANDKTCSDAKDGQRTPCVRGARAVLPQRVFDEYVGESITWLLACNHCRMDVLMIVDDC